MRCEVLLSETQSLEGDELVSALCRNSGTPGGMPALASTDDTSRQSDNLPVLNQACRISSVVSTENILPESGFSFGTPLFSWKSAMEANCLSSANRSA
jgi:hypothetical protein